MPAIGPIARGPFFNGSSDEKNLPSQWSTTDNIAWSVALPGGAAATPIVCGNCVLWRASIPPKTAFRQAVSIAAAASCSGSTTWPKESEKDNRSNYASSSPVADGKLVVFFYGNGELVCFNLDGSRRWRRNIQEDYGPFAFQWTFSSSPTLYDGKLYLPCCTRNVAVGKYGWKDRENQSVSASR